MQIFGSISTAPSGPAFLGERGLISRTSAGNRAISFGLFPEWILQNKAGHLMMFTQRSILNRQIDKNKTEK